MIETNPPATPRSVLHVIIGTYSAIAIIVVLTLAILCIIYHEKDALGMLKDMGLVAIGGLGTFLASSKIQQKESLQEGLVSATTTTSTTESTVNPQQTQKPVP